MKKESKPKRIGWIGVILMAIAGLISGLFLGAYYSEPIMAGVVDYQNEVISDQSTQISELTQMNKNQKDIILDQDIKIDKFEYCYDIEIVTYKDVEKVLKCIEKVKK